MTSIKNLFAIVAIFATVHLLANEKREVQATLKCFTVFIPGQVNQLDFQLTISSPDFEYTDSLWVAFPAGCQVIDTLQDRISTSGSNPEKFRIESFFNDTAYWGNGSGVIGGLKPGTYTFSLQVDIPASITETQMPSFFVKGDAGIQGTTTPKNFRGTYVLKSNQDVPDIGVQVRLAYPYLVDNFNLNPKPQMVTIATIDDKTLDEDATIVSTAEDIPFTRYYVNATHVLDKQFSDVSVGVGLDEFAITSPTILKLKGVYSSDTDPNPGNNADSTFVRFTPYSQSYNDGLSADSSFGFTGSFGALGQVFAGNGVLTRALVYFKSPDSPVLVRAVVYDYLIDSIGEKLGMSDFVVVQNAEEEVEFRFSKPISGFSQGKFFIAIEQYGSNNFGIGLSKANYWEAFNWIQTSEGWQKAVDAVPNWQYNFRITAYCGPERDTTLLTDFAVKLDPNQLPFRKMPSKTAETSFSEVTAWVTNNGLDPKVDANIRFGFGTCEKQQLLKTLSGQTDTVKENIVCAPIAGVNYLKAEATSVEDEVSANDADSLWIEITDEKISYATPKQQGLFEMGVGASSPYVAVSTEIYPVVNFTEVDDFIYAVSLYGDWQVGDSLWAEIYPLLPNGQVDASVLIHASDKEVVSDSIPQPKLIFPGAFIDTTQYGFAVVVRLVSEAPRNAYLNNGVTGNDYILGSGNSVTKLPNSLGTLAMDLWMRPVVNTGIKAGSELQALIFPNPATDELIIQAEEKLDILILDMQGKVIHRSITEQNRKQIAVKGWESGVYLVKLTGQSGVSTSKLVVKQ